MEEIRERMPLIGEDAPAFKAITTKGRLTSLKTTKENG